MALSKIKANSITDDSITVDQIADTAVHGRRNLIINGDMRVAQRGTSFTSNGYNVDRWRNDVVNAGAFTVTQSTTVPSASGFANSVKWDCTTADSSLSASDYLIHSQRIEAQNLQHLLYGTSSAKKVTLSFWVRSNKTGTYWAEIQHSDAGVHSGIRYTINSADTWEFKTLTFDGYQTTAINNDTGIGFFVNWWLAAGTTFTSGTLTENSFHNANANRLIGQVNLADSTSNEWYITGCQLEVGDKATPFEHRSYGEEYLHCLRYTYVWVSGSQYTNITMGLGAANFDTACTATKGPVHLPVPMRGSPSFSKTGDFRVYSNRAQSQLAPTAISINRASAHTPYLQFSHNSMSQSGGHMIEMGANNDTDASITFDAEL